MKTFIASFEFEAMDIDFAAQDAFDILNRCNISFLQTAVKLHAKNQTVAAKRFEKAAEAMEVIMETIKVEEKK